MARIPRPEELHYGDAVLNQHWNPNTGAYTVTVQHADHRIGVRRELWDNSLSAHRIDDQTLVLDTAGEYRYRLVGEVPRDDVLIFERETAAEPTTGGN